MPFDILTNTTAEALRHTTLIVYQSGGVYVFENLLTYIQQQGGSAGLTPITNTLVASGAINPADTFTMITGGTAFTLAAAADTHTHIISNQSGGNVTVTLELNGSSQGILLANGSNLRVAYQAGLSTPTYVQV